MKERLEATFIRICAAADWLHATVSRETNLGMHTFEQIREQFYAIRADLNSIGDCIGELPSTISEPITAIARAINEASVGPGYADVCKSIADSNMGPLGIAAWKAIIRELKPPAIPWADAGSKPAESPPAAAHVQQANECDVNDFEGYRESRHESTIDSLDKLPVGYRDRADSTGAPLDIEFLSNPETYNLPGPYISRNYDGPRIKCGRKHYYPFKEMAAMTMTKKHTTAADD